eukprot:scaffold10723_cov164-Amphora_coffeaeformis.AAC.6
MGEPDSTLMGTKQQEQQQQQQQPRRQSNDSKSVDSFAVEELLEQPKSTAQNKSSKTSRQPPTRNKSKASSVGWGYPDSDDENNTRPLESSNDNAGAQRRGSIGRASLIGSTYGKLKSRRILAASSEVSPPSVATMAPPMDAALPKATASITAPTKGSRLAYLTCFGVFVCVLLLLANMAFLILLLLDSAESCNNQRRGLRGGRGSFLPIVAPSETHLP